MTSLKKILKIIDGIEKNIHCIKKEQKEQLKKEQKEQKEHKEKLINEIWKMLKKNKNK
jgi:hypothetical protein